MGRSRNQETRTISADGYEPDKKASIAHRIAHFLDASAQEYPSQYAAYSLVAKAVLMLGRMPRQDSKEAGMVRRSMARVRQILQKDYRRELDTQVGIGVRATTDSADTLQTSMPKRMRRLESARVAVVQTAQLIDVSTLPNTPALAPWKKWMQKDVKEVLSLLTAPEFEQKLLPPANEDK